MGSLPVMIDDHFHTLQSQAFQHPKECESSRDASDNAYIKLSMTLPSKSTKNNEKLPVFLFFYTLQTRLKFDQSFSDIYLDIKID